MKTSGSLFGATLMSGASALRVAIQIIILPVIGRMLGPTAYGQVALVTPFIFFSMLLAESGLGAVIVRAPKLTDELEGTIFCFSTAISLVFVALFAAIAWPLGELFHEPMFPPLLISMSMMLILAALNVVPAALLMRHKKYDWIALSDTLSTLCGIGGVVAGIVLGWGVWSLVAQQIAFWLSKTALTAIGARFRPHFVFRRAIIRENIYFGSNVTGASILSFISRNIDNVLIGSLMGTQALGFYALAFQIVGLPQTVFSGSLYMTLFATTSEAARNGKVTPHEYLKVLRGVLLISAPAMIGIAVTASLAIPLLLGDKWGPAAWLVVLLMPYGFFGAIGSAGGGVMMGVGKSDVILRMGLILSVLVIVAIVIGSFISSDAVAIGVSLTAIFNSVLYMRVVANSLGTSLRQIARTAAAPTISACLMGCVVLTVEHYMPGNWPLALRFAISTAAGVIAYAAILFGLFHDHIKDDIATVKTALRSRMGKQKA